MLYLRSSDLIHFAMESLYPFITSVYSTPTPGNHHSTFCFYEFDLFLFLDSTYMWHHTVVVFVCLTYFPEYNALQVHLCCYKWQDSFPFKGWVIFCLTFITFPYPFIHWQLLVTWLLWILLLMEKGWCSCLFRITILFPLLLYQEVG